MSFDKMVKEELAGREADVASFIYSYDMEKPPEAEDVAKAVLDWGHGRFVVFREMQDDVWAQRKGVLEDAAHLIRRLVERGVYNASEHFKNEVRAHIRDRLPLIERKKAEAESWPYFAMGEAGGVLDVRPGGTFEPDPDKFLAAHPGVLLFNRLPVEYDPSARCPDYWRFLTHALPSVDDQTLLWDHFASALDRRPRKRRALLIWGPLNCGKTTQLTVEHAVFGEDNTTDVPLADLCGRDRFASAKLVDKMLNLSDELEEDVAIKYLEAFKALTGGGRFNSRNLYQRSFDWWPHNRFHVAANVAPPLDSVNDEAWWDRWDDLNFKVQIENPSERQKRKMLEPSSLSGIFNQLLKVVRRQIENDRFKIVRPGLETKERWLGQSEPARVYALNQVVRVPDEWVSHKELKDDWERWRKRRNPAPAPVSSQDFNRVIADALSLDPEARATPKRVHAWLGISYRGRDKGQAELPGTERTEIAQQSLSTTDEEERERCFSENRVL